MFMGGRSTMVCTAIKRRQFEHHSRGRDMRIALDMKAKWKLAIVVALLLATSGCAVKLTPYYDSILDNSAATLQQKTETYLTRLESLSSPACTYQQNVDFYQQASGEIATMQTRVRAANPAHSKQLVEIISALGQQFEDFKKLQQESGDKCLNNTVIEIGRAGFERVFESFAAYELALKANQPPATAPTVK
jgi:hypothetical protein